MSSSSNCSISAGHEHLERDVRVGEQAQRHLQAVRQERIRDRRQLFIAQIATHRLEEHRNVRALRHWQTWSFQGEAHGLGDGLGRGLA